MRLSCLVIVGYVGHATVQLELDGIRLLTDPVLRNRVGHLRRVAPPASVHEEIDVILVSHAHHDHLDLPSLKLLPSTALVVAPRGAGRLLSRFERVVELIEGDELEVAGLNVRALHAEHPGGRTPFTARGPALSYAILGTRRVYFAGDTGLFPAMDGLVPELDLALLPIWGWGSRLGPGHLDPRSAATALPLLRPRAVVPVHWGTYRVLHRARGVSPAALEAPALAFARAASELAPEVEVRLLRPGDRTAF
jgi:L-ascorbate metabolism protein UlaG (beta-lactamase superfamily)